ncbi:MAG TPA: GNAT family N-acetyltransferase [Phenylobacterium sp.]|nr:GNAT family N-acetyltransferase [Phenylobacterium sp.]
MTEAVRIVGFEALDAGQLSQAAAILERAFAHMPDAWPTPEERAEEVQSFLQDDEREALAALAGERVVGWIGWIESHSHSWELHPLAVDPDWQGRGIGRRLTAELEARARAAGMLSVWLGTDDDFGGTNLFGVDVFPDVLAHAAQAETTEGHPLGFYRKLGYEVVGLFPDANGFGKPDILMAKRIAR